MKTNKLLALFLCFILVFGPVAAMADTTETTTQEVQPNQPANEEKPPILTAGEMAKMLI